MATPTSPEHRIITHMNADHADTLSRLLQHYARVPASSASPATLKAMSLSSLTITSRHNTPHPIRLSPPLQSYSEARTRLIEMDNEARDALGLSDITVTMYRPPTGFYLVVFFAAGLTMLTFSRRSNFLPRSLLYDGLLHYVPRFAGFCHMIQPLLLPVVLAIHFAEAARMATSRLRRHGVRRDGRLWWVWVASTFVEGYGAFMRFDDIVREERERKEKKGH